MAGMLERPTPSRSAIATTSSGDLWLSPSLLAVVTPDEAWLGLRELHYASIGDGGYDYATDAGSMLPDEAQSAYSSAVVAILGQIGATGPQAAVRRGDRVTGLRTERKRGGLLCESQCRPQMAPTQISEGDL